MSDTPWPHFSHDELKCKCGCNTAAMDDGFMQKLEKLRVAFGKPMRVTSGYRCPAHNKAVSKTGATGPHTTGMAVDIQISGADAFKLITIAAYFGITGIGVKQNGPHSKRFVHLDALTGKGKPRPTIWSYP